ncbi:MAG TPA: PIN domain-containing protein [Candidatus Saccharimonadales bacterium]|nr:PIN domain-containing protein [Candidatus Saccharimonadales bacterium]
MNSLDTNVVLRYLLDDVPEQTPKAAAIIDNSASYVTDVVVTEVVFVLERVIGLERTDISRLIQAFLSLPNLIYNDYLLDGVLELYLQQPLLSFVDCYAAIEAKLYANRLVTFDKQLAKHGAAKLLG